MRLLSLQVNPEYKGVCHIALAQEGHCRPGEVDSPCNSCFAGHKSCNFYRTYE